MEKRKYPIGPEHYTLYEEVGQGVSASVHRAICTPLNEIVAIKILDFERDNCDLNNISREAQTMVLVDHPNVLKSHCSFVSDHNLWVIMPFMAGGSCLHILKAAYPDGFEEVVIATVLREVLKGLEYLHHHGHIHRDVKAGNILIDARGAIKLGDFGVSACLFNSGDRQRTRNTFVGTPCWMAPEVMEQLHGYDFKADIWSFGITALELAHGHAPFSKYPPMKVLLMTLQNAPPGLDYERDKKFSKSFKQMTASCLVKDPSKRPSAKKLLKHSFFKQARSNDYILRTLLEGLPALGDRLKALKRKEEDMLAQKKIPDGQMEEMSQNEYKRGISGWNFNLEDVKAQASLIQDEDTPFEQDQGRRSITSSGLDVEKKLQYQLSFVSHSPQVSDVEDNDSTQNQPPPLLADSTVTSNLTKYEKSDNDASTASSTLENQVSQTSSPCFGDTIENNSAGRPGLDVSGRIFDGMAMQAHQRGGASGSFIFPDACFLPSKGESDKLQNQLQNISSSNGTPVPQAVDDAPPEILSRASRTSANSEDLDEKAKGSVVQQRGRFKVTSESVDLDKVAPSPLMQKSHSMQVITQYPFISLPSPTSDPTPPNSLGRSLFPTLLSVLQTNIIQRESILSLMKQVSTGDSTGNHVVDGGSMLLNTTVVEKSLLEAAHDREKELLQEITDLQWRLICAQEELQKYKTDNAHVDFLRYSCFI
ncbi:serine/threonine-protein kinase BLUS1-like isoform X1 [Camellia sinensis]|uniref:serine/threonine-protein kinase BLUS1-like isoform X1 n=2 Tax=Camellia sinensis TaxID=4442 RepID=UPI0010355CA8|nr:serine/threonine-protein kinase BLUS1-like isoform X1 [Camellia sinensis]